MTSPLTETSQAIPLSLMAQFIVAFVRVTRRLPSSYFKISRETSDLFDPALVPASVAHPVWVNSSVLGRRDL